MYMSKPVQRNLKQLHEDGVEILEPSSGVVVCGDEGQGKLADIQFIENRLIEIYLTNLKK
jgi:phosphopantothenoylcysteine decarboxylase/phosphopantothenoylcysteine decarboxylase/phosphopantothenate--cysteine ligase